MSLVATLIAVPGEIPAARFAEQAAEALRALGAEVASPTLLARTGDALDLTFDGIDLDDARKALEPLLHPHRVDVIVQQAAHRRKRLFISDMDSTIIQNECIDELADYAGVKDYVAAITERAMNGELDFKEALTERVGLLKDLPESVLQRAYDERIVLMPGARTLTATMKANGAECVLVSGGFTFFTERVAEAAGFDLHEANVLEVEHGTLTGRVVPPVLDKFAKREALHRHAERLGISLAETLAAGDGANDLPMLLDAGVGVAYHAKPAVREQANAQVLFNDLTALLYAQGYHRDQWVGLDVQRGVGESRGR